MPIIGKKEESEDKEREFKRRPRKLVHSSITIPPREQSEEVKRSVKRDGQQQPIIARPCTCKIILEPHFEAIEGTTRLYGIEKDMLVLLDVRYGLTDYEVFKLAHTAHIRKGRNTFEKAEFYAKMVETKEKESGGVKKLEVALDCQIDPNQLSQYLKIYRLYKVLKAKYPNSIKMLKSFGINRLYNLSRLLDYPQLLDLTLPKAIEKLKKNPRMTAKQIKQMVDGLIKPSNGETGEESKDRFIEPKPDILQIDVPLDLIREIRDIVFLIEDIAEKEMKESKIHWTKRVKILRKLWIKEKRTMQEIALECLRMGVEDVKYGRKVYPVNLCFEVLHGAPIGFKGIFKERPKKRRKNEEPKPLSMEDFMPQPLVKDVVSLNALRKVDKENTDAKKIKLEFENREKDKNPY